MSGYKDLLTYEQCEEIYDLTVEFCDRFLSGRENLRIREQMIHAARSAKQCIAEGATQGTSLKGYIKMIGISRGSLEELLKDYEDFARQRGFTVWGKEAPGLREMGERVKKGKRVTGKYKLSSISSQPSLPSNSLNYMIDLVTRTGYLLDRQRKSLEEKFIKEGGYTENLFKRRLHYRNSTGK